MTLKPLYKLMIDRDITWADIRRNVPMQPEHLSRLRRGMIPPLYVLERVMDWLGCGMTDIVGWEI